MKYSFSSILEQFPGDSAYFVCYLPLEIAAEIDSVSHGLRGGFGSVRIHARLGKTVWDTSIFKETRRSSYLMLVKKTVRQAERLIAGDVLHVEIELVDF